MPTAQLTDQAREALQAGQLSQARRLLRQAVHEDPRNQMAWLLLAEATADSRVAAEYAQRAAALSVPVASAQAARARARQQARLRAAAGLMVLLGGVLLLSLFFGRDLWAQAGTGLGQLGVQARGVAEAPSLPTPLPTKAIYPATSVALMPFAAGDTAPSTATATAVFTPRPTSAATTAPAEDTLAADETEPRVTAVPDAALPEAIVHGMSAEDLPVPATATTAVDIVASVDDAIASAEQEEATPLPTDAPPEEESIRDAALATASPAEEAAAQSFDSLAAAAGANGERWIDVNLSTQTLVAYEGETAVFSTLISSGLYNFPTVTGEFRTWLKYESQDMNGYLLGYDYFLPGVPYVMYFFQDYAIHGAYWHNSFGTPMSHGCVNVSPTDAGWLFEWAPLGTLVSVHY